MREEAYRKIAAGLQMQAEGYAALALLKDEPRAVAPTEELLTVEEAAALLRFGEVSTVYRWLRDHPEAKRKAGSRLRVEKHALLRATRR